MLARTRITSAHVEVFCGLTCAVLAPAAWIVDLFAPIHTVIASGDGYPGPTTVDTSPVDEVHGLDNFIRLSPIWSLLLLAYLLCALGIGYGAFRHGRRADPSGRLVVWASALLLLLLTPTFGLPDPRGPYTQLPEQLLWLALAVCVALAIIAAVAALGVEEVRRRIV
jgi:hypothetical protein